MAALAVTVMLLFITTLAVLHLHRSTLSELKVAANLYDQARAFEAAQLGLERGVAWLKARALADERAFVACNTQPLPYSKSVWGPRPGQSAAEAIADPYEYMTLGTACNAGLAASSSIVVAGVGHEVRLEFRRRRDSLQDLYRVEVVASAYAGGGSTLADRGQSQATVVQAVALRQFNSAHTQEPLNVPLLLRLGAIDIRSRPSVCPVNPSYLSVKSGTPCAAGAGSPGVAIATLQSTITGFIDTLAFDPHGGEIKSLDRPTSTVLETVLPGMTEADIRAISEYQFANVRDEAQRTVFYYGAHSSYGMGGGKLAKGLGSPERPVLVFVSQGAYAGSNCPKFGGGQYYGIFYFGRDCAGQGWGSVDIHGVLAIEGSLTKFSANATLRHHDVRSLAGPGWGALRPGALTKIAGSWRDFRHEDEV